MNRQIFLLALTTVISSCYLGSVRQQDTLPNSANRLAKAIICSDTDTIWEFVPQDERKYYSLDKFKFAAYWKKIVQPHLSGVNSFDVAVAGSNGLDIIVKGPLDSRSQKIFSLLVSGQKGQYYVPYIIGASGLHAAAASTAQKNLATYQRFDIYSKWIRDSKKDLFALGFPKIRRGPLFPGETPDEMENHFKGIADEDFARTEVTGIIRLAGR